MQTDAEVQLSALSNQPSAVTQAFSHQHSAISSELLTAAKYQKTARDFLWLTAERDGLDDIRHGHVVDMETALRDHPPN